MEAEETSREKENKERLSFPPPKRPGLMLQSAAALLFAAAGLAFFYFASREELGLIFVALLLGGLAWAAPAIMLGRRVQALRNADYQLDREGLRILWGGREEHIPMDHIQWVRLEETLEAPLALPRWRWPGAVLGKRRHAAWGEMEFLASRGDELVLIGAGKRVFVISPEGRDDFIQGFREMIELGSLKGMQARSMTSAYLLQEISQSSKAWILLAVSALINLCALLLAAWQAPQIESISLGFSPRGAPLPAVPGVQIFLLPIASLTFFAATFVLAGAVQRRDPASPYPFILFGANLLASALFITALIILLARN